MASTGLTVSEMRERVRCCHVTMREVEERARQVCLMRLFAKRWRSGTD